MSIIQWIKLKIDLFDDEKILLISTMPNAESILLTWIRLLCLAGKQNNKGVFMMNDKPYTVSMLAMIMRIPEETLDTALKVFEDYKMITYVNGAITITNWGKHQNLDKLEANKAYMRNYMKEYRKKQKAVASGKAEDKLNGKVNHKVKINSADKDLEIDKDKELEEDKDKSIHKSENSGVHCNYQSIINSFNSICKSLPSVKSLSNKRKKGIDEIQALMTEITFEQFFEKIESSDFLTGRTGDWQTSFDWIIKPTNAVKILEGNYDNRTSKPKENYSDTERYKNIKWE